MSEFRTTRMGTDHCPMCNGLCDAATHRNDKIPNPGDFTICFYCGCILRFASDMALELVTVEELEIMPFEQLSTLGALQREVLARLDNSIN